MRYEKGHKEATRLRIIETAAARFRRDGIESVGVADLMSDAGLTHGGFYSHFSSKEDLVRAVVEQAVIYSAENFQRRIDEGGLEGWIRSYLRTQHRDAPEKGCFVAALGSELPRHSKVTRQCFTKRLVTLTSDIQKFLPSSMKPAQKRKTAVGIFATLVGALQIARTVDDVKLSDEILDAGIASALTLAHLAPVAA
jgi:TetR/AcrR family transcriptional repressor of nem operon